MTTPAPATPVISLSTDKASYNVGDTLTLTIAYADAQSVPSTLTITVNGTDSQNNAVSSTATVMVTRQVSEAMTFTVTDNAGATYTQVSNDGTSQAVFTATVQAPPAAAPGA